MVISAETHPNQQSLEESLRLSDARFRAVFDQSAVGMAVATRNGTLVRVNEAFAALLGYERQELIGRSFIEITHPEDRHRAESIVQRAEHFPGPMLTYEKRYLRKDGGAAWARVTVSRLCDELGQLLGYTGIIEDIGAARASELALASQMDLQHRILDAMPLLVAIWRDGRASYVNRAWQETFGHSVEQAGRLSFDGFMQPGDSTPTRARALGGTRQTEWMDFEPQARDGSAILSSWLCVSLPDGSKLTIGQDVRERRKVEAQVTQAQKMEALGQLAGGVAHDFNNLLTVIGACVSFLKQGGTDEQSAKDLADIADAADRAAALTRQLLAFSRQQVLTPDVVDVNRAIQQTTKTLRRLIGEHIEFNVVPIAERAAVEVDVHQLDQVVMNLVVNARDAIGNRGTITIATENVMRSDKVSPARDYLALCVSDDGCGIDPAIRDQIFNPFFTTKETGRGTGLGLATVHGIIVQSGGRIEVDSTPGTGTTFRVLLPTVDACPTSAVVATPVDHNGRNQTILLVEDDASLRCAARRMLTNAGYQVLEARHGADALEVFAKQGPIDLVVTDVVMPQMGGRELLTNLRELAPGLPALFITGYTDDELLRKGILEPRVQLLRKPFYSADLVGAVSRLLEPVAA